MDDAVEDFERYYHRTCFNVVWGLRQFVATAKFTYKFDPVESEIYDDYVPTSI